MASLYSCILLVALTGSCFASPQYGGVSGGPSVPVADRQCNHPSYDCVPYFQCIDGKINTDGAGLIDLRIQPQASCVNPNYPEVPGLCCLIPGATPTPSPVDVCPQYKECVDYKICGPDGYVITDGEGLIDIRTGIHTSCWLSHGIGGVCCNPPKQYVDSCPGNSVCTLGSQCYGQALDASSNFIDYVTTGSWSLCNYGVGQDGVCCIPPYIDSCPSGSVCTLGGECFGKALDASNNFIDYVTTGLWTFCNYGNQNGICCIPPFRETCPGGSVCVYANECVGRKAWDKFNQLIPYSSTGSWDLCSIGGQEGVCCSKTSDIIDICPGNSVCLKPSDCFGTALTADTFVDYISTGTWTHCSQYDQGVCCVNPPQCGIRNYKLDQRITDIKYNPAEEAEFGEFPWQGIVFYANYTFICGASLISDRHVITAAHCVDGGLLPGDIRLRFGEWAVSTYDEPYEYQDKNVYAIHIHPDFNYKNNRNDIAVLELAEPFTAFSYHINSICLPGPGLNYGINYRCIATGWGKDTFDGNYQVVLKKVELPYVPHGACQDKLRKTRLGKWYALDKSFVCAGGELGKDACTGDGGGPLVCRDIQSNQYVLVGVTSFGIGCGEHDVPGVYANVEYLKPWVDSIVLGPTIQPVPGYGN